MKRGWGERPTRRSPHPRFIYFAWYIRKFHAKTWYVSCKINETRVGGTSGGTFPPPSFHLFCMIHYVFFQKSNNSSSSRSVRPSVCPPVRAPARPYVIKLKISFNITIQINFNTIMKTRSSARPPARSSVLRPPDRPSVRPDILQILNQIY